MTNRMALALALAVLATVPLLVWPESKKAIPASGHAQREEAVAQTPATLLEVEESRRAPVIAEEEVLFEPPFVEEKAPEQSRLAVVTLVTLRGRITVVDPEGIEHAAEEGSMELHCIAGDETLEIEVAVQEGAWSCEMPSDASFWIWDLELGGKSAACDINMRNQATVPEDRFLAIEARWPPPSVLIVKARDTGLELDEIQIVGDLPFPEGEGQHPGRFDPRYVLDVPRRSPIALPVWRASVEELTLFARSPGYAWRRIDLDQSLGGERILTLARGGDLLVSFRGHAVAEGSVLSIRSPGEHTPVMELPLSDGSDVEIESLEAARYQVSVQMGSWFENPVELGTSDVDVVADRVSAVVVLLSEPPAVQTASLSGRLVIPDGWPVERPYLSFSLQGSQGSGRKDHFGLHEDGMTRTSDHPVIYEWNLPEVQAGRWEIQLDDPPWQMSVDVEPGSRSEVVLEVPPPALVRLTVVERGTDLLADLAQVSWRSYLPGSSGGIVIPVARDPQTGAFEFRATVGEITVTAWGDNPFSKTFEIHEGLNELRAEVEAHRPMGVVVVLKDGSTIVPWGSDWNVYPERIDAGRTGWGTHDVDQGRGFTVHYPGLYRITIPEIDGYLPVAPLEIQFAPGPHPTIEVPLIRAR